MNYEYKVTRTSDPRAPIYIEADKMIISDSGALMFIEEAHYGNVILTAFEARAWQEVQIVE